MFKEKGIEAARIKMEPKGARELLDPGFSAFGAAKNRRVVFEILAPADSFSQMPQLTKLKIAGKVVRVAGSEFSANVKIIENRPIKLELAFDTGGHSTLWLYPQLPDLFSGQANAYSQTLKDFLVDWRKTEKSSPTTEKSISPKDNDDKEETKPEETSEALMDPQDAFDGIDDAIPYIGEGTPPLWWPSRGQVPAAKMELWAPSKETKIVDMATLVNELTGNKSGIIHTEKRKWDTKSRLLANIDRAKELLGYDPQSTFEEGLEQTIQWFRENWDAINRDAEFPPGMSSAVKNYVLLQGQD